MLVLEWTHMLKWVNGRPGERIQPTQAEQITSFMGHVMHSFPDFMVS